MAERAPGSWIGAFLTHVNSPGFQFGVQAYEELEVFLFCRIHVFRPTFYKVQGFHLELY